MDNYICPVCTRKTLSYFKSISDTIPMKIVTCNVCGKFAIHTTILEDFPREHSNYLDMVERWLYDTKENEEWANDEPDRLAYTGTLDEDFLKTWKHPKSLDMIVEDYTEELSLLEKYDIALIRISDKTTKLGEYFPKSSNLYIVPTNDKAEASNIIDYLAHEDLISTDYTLPTAFRITPLGLVKASGLKQTMKTKSNNVFIAACFNVELEPAVRAIGDAIRSSGYTPQVVNRVSHSELIETKIYELIQNCKFMVADLTCQRQSVYYEVGYAHALGKPVILTCRKDHFKGKEADKHLHFDIAHRLVLEWQNLEELRETIENHIMQEHGRGPVPSSTTAR